MTVSAGELESSDVIRRIEGREIVLCPSCRAELEPIPKIWQPGMRLSGVACPRSQQHYLTLLDDADAADAIRGRFRTLQSNDSAEKG